MKLRIAHARLIDPANRIDRMTDLYIADGLIAAIDEAPAGFTPEREIDARGLIVAPGLVDLCARLREPGNEYRATLESEMHAAMAGGVTSLAIPPDTDPPLDEPGLVEMLCHRAKKLNRAHIYPVGALTLGLRGERLSEMAELTAAGCVAFSQASRPITNNAVLLRTLQYASTFGFRVWCQPSDPYLTRDGFAHDGKVAAHLGLPPIAAAAETIALYTILQLAEHTGARLHIAQISCASSLPLIRDARARGMDVTCDIDIHHLHLDENDIGYFDANCHLIPPLRAQEDRAALRAALAAGEIDALCSNHAPVNDEAKALPFNESEAGATALELLLPLTLKWAREENIALPEALARVTIAPARIIGSQRGGHLSVGTRADLCIFDPEGSTPIARETLVSNGKNTPFLGQTLPGKVRYTIVEGQIMHASDA